MIVISVGWSEDGTVVLVVGETEVALVIGAYFIHLRSFTILNFLHALFLAKGFFGLSLVALVDALAGKFLLVLIVSAFSTSCSAAVTASKRIAIMIAKAATMKNDLFITVALVFVGVAKMSNSGPALYLTFDSCHQKYAPTMKRLESHQTCW